VALELVQVRECDGGCCKASPRFPNAVGDDCIYRTDTAAATSNQGCSLMSDKSPIYGKTSPTDPSKTAVACFNATCLNWPHDSAPKLGKTGDECCWQWTEV